MFEADFPVVALLIARRFVFPEAILLLALLRLILGQGWVRLPAAAAVLLASGITITVFAPALGLAGTALYGTAARALVSGGVALLLAPSALLLLGAFSRRRPWPWIEIAVVALTLAFILLWAATRI
ncbi:hypothetical protein [Primorskyibacter flagellatus]|uniref:Uncharacterized protein n=1 Tax=Primorskyibacter flagellatus TaxID=1387277 RepID=A0A1W2BLV9_9RHOB|nr:hypothetical protein [Primorskyibacter flagellatus]SMC73806.1 hypothetical protein SAMN06295998_104150 [Primorskyibacter flagellatus]